jgi:MinD-like ATPase involved in chromosome partitioning or flagellar assembly
MADIISIHSFRGGTGKTNTAANVAALLAADGHRVGVVDSDIQSPGIHVLFGLAGESVTHALNDYLWGSCEIAEVARDVTGQLGPGLAGKIFLVPASILAGEITRVLRDGYDVQKLAQGLRDLIEACELDVLLIDTHPGLNEETLLSMALAHNLVIVLRPDQQDYEGTGVAVQVARQLDVPRLTLVVNKTPPGLDPVEVRAQVEAAYDCQVAAVLPHSDELMALASRGIFSLQYPDHPLTAQYRALASALVANPGAQEKKVRRKNGRRQQER